MEDRPLCFVLMPFGSKKDPTGGPNIDFDAIYEQALRPGIEAAGMEPIRADEERTGGIIHRAMFERLLLCDVAVADLTTANPNVFYELGIRHAARPATTLAVFAANHAPPFDLNYLRSLPYDLSEGNRFGPDAASRLRTAVARRLTELREVAADSGVDSPLFQLLTDYPVPNLAHMKTDVFRDRARYAASVKQQLAAARAKNDVDSVHKVESALPPLDIVETGVLVDLFLSYRAVSAYDRMVELYEKMPLPLQRTVLVREQLAFALNRLERRDDAAHLLQRVIDEGNATSETYGLIGRIHKDLWADAEKAGNEWAARAHLDRAIASYVRGFERDLRDAYPGINAVTLLEIRGDAASLSKKEEILPVVRFALKQRLQSSKPDYWDYATLLELAVLARDETATHHALGDAITAVREPWEPMTTVNNLTLIRDARLRRDGVDAWLEGVIGALAAAGTPTKR